MSGSNLMQNQNFFVSLKLQSHHITVDLAKNLICKFKAERRNNIKQHKSISLHYKLHFVDLRGNPSNQMLWFSNKEEQQALFQLIVGNAKDQDRQKMNAY